jgi:hypothetical protein
VRVTAAPGIEEATLAAELANYALGVTIEKPVTMGPQAAPNPGPAEPALKEAKA